MLGSSLPSTNSAIVACAQFLTVNVFLCLSLRASPYFCSFSLSLSLPLSSLSLSPLPLLSLSLSLISLSLSLTLSSLSSLSLSLSLLSLSSLSHSLTHSLCPTWQSAIRSKCSASARTSEVARPVRVAHPPSIAWIHLEARTFPAADSAASSIYYCWKLCQRHI